MAADVRAAIRIAERVLAWAVAMIPTQGQEDREP